MTFTLPPLPFARDALEPYISAETIDYHYGKHHQAYVDKLNALVADTPMADLSLEAIIHQSEGGVFNNAAQVWNHTFYWNCLSAPDQDPMPKDFEEALIQDFGSVESFKKQFTEAAIANFGSGWTWLAVDVTGKLRIVSTSNAQNLLTTPLKALMTCDVWEHAYYIDARNSRPKYLENFWEVINMNFVAQNWHQAEAERT